MFYGKTPKVLCGLLKLRSFTEKCKF